MFNANQTFLELEFPQGMVLYNYRDHAGIIQYRLALALADFDKLINWCDAFRANAVRVRDSVAKMQAPEQSRGCQHPEARRKLLADGNILCLDCTAEMSPTEVLVCHDDTSKKEAEKS